MRIRSALAVAALLAVGCSEGDSAVPPAVAPERCDSAEPLRPSASTAPPPARVGKTAEPAASDHEPHPGHAEPDVVLCPAPRADVDAVLDQAAQRYDAGDYRVALACAEVAVDLVPQAVEAQHLRAAALAALGRLADSQVGFAMALALDPNDPETLAAAADFYINLLAPKRRQTILVGLEYARRGSERAATRRRLDRGLRGRLILLEAEALNDLGASSLALPRIHEALEWMPSSIEAEHERGVSLFNLCRFEEAEEAFLAVLGRAPGDPYAHYHLGLIYERQGRADDAQAHFRRARELAPAEFPEPAIPPAAEFRAEVEEAIAELPPAVREQLAQVKLELVDLPAIEDLRAAEPPFAPTILGLFRGAPLGVVADGASELPERAIVLYRLNLARAAGSRAELDRQIRRTLLHEIGHLQGLDEDQLRRRGLE